MKIKNDLLWEKIESKVKKSKRNTLTEEPTFSDLMSLLVDMRVELAEMKNNVKNVLLTDYGIVYDKQSRIRRIK